MTDEALAQYAYEVYAKHQNWQNFQGLPIPPWSLVRLDIQAAWDSAAQAVREVVGTQGGWPPTDADREDLPF